MFINGTELALRAGINTVLQKSNRTNSTDFAGESDAMVSNAESHMQMFLQTSSSAASASKLLGEHMDVIKLTVLGVVLAYKAISGQMATLNEQRKNFEEELLLKMATFMIPGNLEAKDLSGEQQAVAGLFEKLEKYPLLFAYSGVKIIPQEENPRTKRYCALPLYSMRQLEHPIASPRALDQARTAIHTLFSSKAMRCIQNIADDFRTDNKGVAFIKSTYEQNNYLNDRRAPRLILTVLFNILWNIQHPVDCETGYSLTLNDGIRLCAQFKNLLNVYLADKTPTGPHAVNTNENGLHQMLLHIELRATKLHIGFIDEKLRQFNLKDLTNNAHRTLRELDTSLLQLIFNKKDPVTGIYRADALAAPDIADTLGALNELLNKNPSLLSFFNEENEKISGQLLPQTYLNPHVRTIIDVLIVFCHLDSDARNALLDRLSNAPGASEDLRFLARELYRFNKHYIAPLEASHLRWIKNTLAHIPEVSLSKLTASRVIPLFTLVAADYRIDVDPRKNVGPISESRDTNSLGFYYSGKEQVQLINDSAQIQSLKIPDIERGEYAYHWAVSPYLTLTHQAALAVDSLPGRQYEMTQITELLDGISELTQNYRSFLQFKTFQLFLLDCLHRVRNKYSEFSKDALGVDLYLSADGLLDRTLRDILQALISKLSDNLLTFEQTIQDITHIVGSPDFIELRKQELLKQIYQIERKYTELFDEAPIHFINTYQQIIPKVEVASLHTDKTDKIKKVYEFSKQFFMSTRLELTSKKPNLPNSPHFLSQLKKEKLDKYLGLIQSAIEHIDALLEDSNYSLDPHELFRQLQMIDSNQKRSRKPDDIKKSTYCQVVIEELKRRLEQQLSPSDSVTEIPLSLGATSKTTSGLLLQRPLHIGSHAPTTPHRNPKFEGAHLSFRQLPVSIPSDPKIFSPPARRSSFGVCAPLKRKELTPNETAQRLSEEDRLTVASAPTPFSAFTFLKEELHKKLSDYANAKKQENPTHWFYHLLQSFKDFFGRLSSFIKARLRVSKIQVAQKVMDAMASATEKNPACLSLTPLEMTTLSHGSLGQKTLFFREAPFWNQITRPIDVSLQR